MKVYIDLVLILNMWLDFLIILSVSLILKRNTTIKKIFLASLVGSFSTFFLFFNINSFFLILLKLFVCIVMNLIAFNFKNMKYVLENIVYFYMVSIILAGFIYLIKNNYGLDNFLNNFLFLVIVSPLILFFYYKKTKKMNNHYNHLYKVELYYEGKSYQFTAFLDTGNKLYDQYKKRPIILVYTKDIIFDYAKGILVSYTTANGKSILKCLEAEKIIINGNIEKRKVIFGLVDDKLNMADVNMILHSDLIGG